MLVKGELLTLPRITSKLPPIPFKVAALKGISHPTLQLYL
jgi:hypothetical protein